MSETAPKDMQVVLQASGAFEAELACSILRRSDISALVLDPCLSHWFWFARVAFTRGGVRVVVPAERVEHALKVLQEARQAGQDMSQQGPDDFDEQSEAAWLGGATLGIMVYLALFNLLGTLLFPWLLWLGLKQLVRATRANGSRLSGWARFHYVVGWGLIAVLAILVCLGCWFLLQSL